MPLYIVTSVNFEVYTRSQSTTYNKIVLKNFPGIKTN